MASVLKIHQKGVNEHFTYIYQEEMPPSPHHCGALSVACQMNVHVSVY